MWEDRCSRMTGRWPIRTTDWVILKSWSIRIFTFVWWTKKIKNTIVSLQAVPSSPRKTLTLPFTLSLPFYGLSRRLRARQRWLNARVCRIYFSFFVPFWTWARFQLTSPINFFYRDIKFRSVFFVLRNFVGWSHFIRPKTARNQEGSVNVFAL